MQHDSTNPSPRQHQYSYIKRQFHIFRRHNISIVKQALAMVAVTGFILYAMLFTNVPALHDFFHELRHVLGIIPCH